MLQTEVGVPALQTEPLFSKRADGSIGEFLQCAAAPVLGQMTRSPNQCFQKGCHQFAADCTDKLSEAELNAAAVHYMGPQCGAELCSSLLPFECCLARLCTELMFQADPKQSAVFRSFKLAPTLPPAAASFKGRSLSLVA